MKKVQINPAARKPLYNPWLAARTLVGLNNSAGIDPLNTFFPLVSQANISSQSIYKCSRAMMAISDWTIIFI